VAERERPAVQAVNTVEAPPRGLYAIGSAGLAIEAIVLLLAAPAVLSLERGHVSGLKVGYLFVMALLLIVAAARLRKRGGKAFASAIQVLVIAGGVITWPMYIVGLAFAGIWIYWLRLWPGTWWALPASKQER
jgi:Protein of unknown function (DUF4233)